MITSYSTLKPGATTAPPARLVFFIREGLLVGHAGIYFFRINVVSGGGGGSLSNLTDPSVVNNPEKVSQRITYKDTKNHSDVTAGNRGGPIPPGVYGIAIPTLSNTGKSFLSNLLPKEESTKLLLSKKRLNRDSFQIHRTGKYGSDGCIVSVNDKEHETLMESLKLSKGGTLSVYLSQSETTSVTQSEN